LPGMNLRRIQWDSMIHLEQNRLVSSCWRWGGRRPCEGSAIGRGIGYSQRDENAGLGGCIGGGGSLGGKWLGAVPRRGNPSGAECEHHLGEAAGVDRPL